LAEASVEAMAGVLVEVLAETGSAAVEALADGGGPHLMLVATGDIVVPTTAPQELRATPPIAHGAVIRSC